jgi:hypothetical protein
MKTKSYPKNPFKMTKYLFISFRLDLLQKSINPIKSICVNLVSICGSKSLKPSFRIGSKSYQVFEPLVTPLDG